MSSHQFMARALELARLGIGTCQPNPHVGCVLVRDGAVVGEGWHRQAGGAHAEINALLMAGDAANGATAYVTLEPCSHHGKTPPCADALIAAGIKQVFVAMQDPNPLVAGQGISRLRAHGIAVECGLLQQEAEALNPGFLKRMRTGIPFVRSKLACSVDGRTALANGSSFWITGADARADVHHYRARSSAIVTGIGTVLADDPALTARPELLSGHSVIQPLRVILDRELRTPVNARILRESGHTLIVASSVNALRKQRLEQAGAEVVALPVDELNRPDAMELLKLLGQRGCNEVWFEAGPTVNGMLLATDWVDEWIVYMAPCVLGDVARPMFFQPELALLSSRKRFRWTDVRQIGADLRLTMTTLNLTGD